jgi:hypothetical protein
LKQGKYKVLWPFWPNLKEVLKKAAKVTTVEGKRHDCKIIPFRILLKPRTKRKALAHWEGHRVDSRNLKSSLDLGLPFPELYM